MGLVVIPGEFFLSRQPIPLVDRHLAKMKGSHALDNGLWAIRIIPVSCRIQDRVLLEAGNAGLPIQATDMDNRRILSPALGKEGQNRSITVADNTIVRTSINHLIDFVQIMMLRRFAIIAEGMIKLASHIFVHHALSASSQIKCVLKHIRDRQRPIPPGSDTDDSLWARSVHKG